MGFCPIFGRIQGKMSPWGQNIYSNPGHPNPQSPVRDDIFKKSLQKQNRFIEPIRWFKIRIDLVCWGHKNILLHQWNVFGM